MQILISNDDGYLACGLQALAEAMSRFGSVTVIAPEADRSGAGQSLTLDRPLAVKCSANGYYYVNGTPADCVHLACTGLLDELPDLVVSGINHGANLGNDVWYSGTVAAAAEAAARNIPGLAVSLNGRLAKSVADYAQAALWAQQVVEKLLAGDIAPGLLNLNIPFGEQVKGLRVCRLGQRQAASQTLTIDNPRGGILYWIGAVGDIDCSAEDTDFSAIAAGYASLTPLSMDRTQESNLAALTSVWKQHERQ